MKKALSLLLALSMVLALTACGSSAQEETTDPAEKETQEAAEPVELYVFAAASLEESLNQAIAAYEAANEGVTIVPTYDSSGTLKTQIQEGADCDVFISAAPKQMNQLDAQGGEENTEGLDFVDSATRLDLLENKVTLAVPEGNPKGIETFDQLAELLQSGDVMLAMGNSDVPDAFSAGLTVVDEATADMCGQVIYPAAVMKNSANPEAAKAFLDFLSTDEALACFEAVGFSPLV